MVTVKRKLENNFLFSYLALADIGSIKDFTLPPSPPPPTLADKEVRKHLSLSSLPLPYFSPVQGRYSCMISPLLGKCRCFLDLPSLICLNQIKGHALAKFFQVWIFHYFKPQQTELMRAK